MRVLFAASEVFPLMKTGGLADVAYGLPQALQQQGADVRLMLPAYHDVLLKLDQPRVLGSLEVQGAGRTQNDAVFVLLRQFFQQHPHFADNIQRREAQVLVAAKAHPRALADEGYLLTVGEHHDVFAWQYAPRRIDGPLHQRHASEFFHQLVGNDGVFLDGGDDNTAFFHGKPLYSGPV